MLKRTLILILSCFAFIQMMGQKTVDFPGVENGTLKYYYSGNYDSLVLLGKAALKNKIDYFYLRYRLGFAYFAKNKFRQAAHQLEKATKFNSLDENTKAYLYNSYKYSGNDAEAQVLSKKMPAEDFPKGVKPHKFGIVNVYAEGGYGFTDEIQRNHKIDLDGDTNIYGESNLTRSLAYAHAGFKIKLGAFLNIYQGYSFIDISKQKNIKRNDSLCSYNYDIIQHEYYINADIRAAKTLTITPAFHFIYVNFKEPVYHYDSLGGTLTSPLTEIYNYTGSLMISKDFWLMRIGLGGTFSYLNKDYKTQGIATIDFFPLGNLNLYTHTVGAFIYEDKPSVHHAGKRFVVEQMLGFKVFSKLWTELDFTYGDLSNYVEKNAFVIYNFTDKTRFRAEMSFVSPIFRNFEISLRYQFFSKENYYLTYSDYITTQFKSMNYSQHNIIGGIKWKF